MKKVVRIKESELVNLIDKIITETTRKQKISEGVRNLAGKQIIKEEMVLNESNNNLVTFLTSLEKNLSKNPQKLATEITNYLNTVLDRKSIKQTPKNSFYLGKGRVEPFLKMWAYIDKSRGFVVNEEILNFLVKADNFLRHERAEEVVMAYLKDQQLPGSNERFGGFQRMTDTFNPNELKSQ